LGRSAVNNERADVLLNVHPDLDPGERIETRCYKKHGKNPVFTVFLRLLVTSE
jgi:hypothetical protein